MTQTHVVITVKISRAAKVSFPLFMGSGSRLLLARDLAAENEEQAVQFEKSEVSGF